MYAICMLESEVHIYHPGHRGVGRHFESSEWKEKDGEPRKGQHQKSEEWWGRGKAVGWGSDQGREVEGVLHSSTPCWPVAMGSNTSYPDFDSAQFPSTLPYLPRICMCPSGGDIESPVNFSPCSV